jgi:ribosomal protein L14
MKRAEQAMPDCSGRRVALAVAGLLLVARITLGATPSGNEFARDLAEAKTPSARKMILDDALGKQHFFRYLRIVNLEQGESGGNPFIELTTREPSSGMTVKLKVMKSLSLATLKEAPASGVGDAVAVTGVIQSADPVKRVMVLNPVVVRYKDLLAPKVGKEMHYERDSSGIVYSFTGGKEAVNVSKRDEDLLKNEGTIIAERGKDGWARYLLDEIAKRDKAADAARDKLGIYKQSAEPAVPAAPSVPPQSVITDDEN